MGGCCFLGFCLFARFLPSFLPSFLSFFFLFSVSCDCVDFSPSLSISFFSQEVQTAGARLTKHWPELLEHVVWSQQLWVLRLTNGSSG